MLTLSITISGHTDGDLELALQEVRSLVNNGNTSGGNSNDTGSFSFSISGDPEAVAITCPNCGASDNFSTCEEATVNGATYVAYSGISGFDPDGSIEFDGTTDYSAVPGGDPDDCGTVVDDDDHPRLSCGHCKHEWFESQLAITE